MSKTLEKVRKLLAKAESTSSEHEAEALAQKAQEILLREGLTLSDVGPDTGNSITETIQSFTYTDKWRITLYSACAKLYMCEAIIYSRERKLGIVGRPDRARVAVEMMMHLDRTVVRMAREYSLVRRERLNFERGCGTSIAARLYRLSVEAEEGRGAASGDSRLPVLYKSELEQAGDFMRDLYPDIKPRRSLPTRATPSFMDGYQAGYSVTLSSGEIS